MISGSKNKTQHNYHIDQGISVVVLTYNSSFYISKCIKSLQSQLSKKSEIIVVDNKSTDKSVAIEKKIKGIKLIVNSKNYGFARGVNKGIKSCKNDLILILNPDTIVKPGAIKELIKCLNLSRGDIIGGKALMNNGKTHGTFVRTPTITTLLFDYTNLRKLVPFDIFHTYHYYLNDKITNKFKSVDAVSGAFMLIKKEVIRSIGSFDERFWMYLEDVDFCIRAKKYGYKIIYCPKASVVHIGGASSPNSDRINHTAWYDARSQYAKKHLTKILNIFVQIVFLFDKKITNFWQSIK